jgi:hypothetical protein
MPPTTASTGSAADEAETILGALDRLADYRADRLVT